MPLINTSIPNLIQGVSQQPDPTRFSGQCEEQENAMSSVVDGLKKRPNTRYIAELLDTALSQRAFVHFMDRDDDEKFVIISENNSLRVFNILTGQEAIINYNGSPNASGVDLNNTYLDIDDPQRDLKALTVADNTFLLNRTVRAAERPEITPDFEGKAVTFVLQGDFAKNYKCDFGAGSARAKLTYTVYVSDGGDDGDDCDDGCG